MCAHACAEVNLPLSSMAHLFLMQSLTGVGLTWLPCTDYLRNPPIPAQLTLEV